MQNRGVAEIYIGGAADGQSRIVASYVATRKRALAETSDNRTAAWFSYFDLHDTISHCLDALSQGRSLVLVGHSWGGDTVLKVAHQLPGPVELLAGVDPVMRPGSFLTPVCKRPANAGTIVHVDARPKRLDRSDFVKATGVVMGFGLAPAFRRADLTIRTEFNHWAFASMMNAENSDGLSLSQMIHDTGSLPGR